MNYDAPALAADAGGPRTAPVARERLPGITYIFRKSTPTVFSIEKLFDALYAHFEASGAEMRRIEVPHVSSGIFSVLCNVWFVARQRKTKVVHITGDVHYAALLSAFSRTMITIHDCVALQRGTGLKRFVMWALWFGLPVRLASSIVVISEQTKRELLKTVPIPKEKITVIPNFVGPEFVFSERQFASAQPRILQIGTSFNKNLPRVIESLRGIPCVLVIVGPLSQRTTGELKASGVRYENFVGVDDSTMLRLYRDADIISYPSTYEGFGMPILEGQAIGRPVLTSDQEPMRGVAGSGALLVDPESVEAIRNGFLRLIGDAALRARLIAAGKENCSRYKIEAVAASYLALYRRLASR